MKTRSILGAAAALVVAAALASGCGSNDGNPVGYGPEGEPGAPLLLLTALPDSTRASGVTLLATILSPPPANGFRLYLDPDNQGYRPASDGLVSSVATLGSGWSIYSAPVDGYDPAVATHFVARGARDGVESLAAPLSNTAFLPATDRGWLLNLAPVQLTTPGDSTNSTLVPTFAWTPVPGASRYFLQVLSIGGFSGTLQVYGAITSATTHTFGVGPGLIVEQQPLREGGFYLWTVQAINDGSRVFAVSFVPSAFFIPAPPTP
jgi:hypothetical protein